MDKSYELPRDLGADLDKLGEYVAQFKAGDLSPEAFRSRRVPQGVYEQRLDGRHMLRVRLPAGVLLPDQLRKCAKVARAYGDGRLHITTRQDIQVHDILIDGIQPALRELAEANLSTKGGGGNTVRNIMGCADAGVCPHEVIDVAPHVVSLTEFMLADPLSFQMPRKFKIAFSGCSEDCIGAGVNDVAFIAKQGPEGPGFAVYTGGGMGSRPRISELLEKFVPASEAHLVAQAIKRVFDQHGNRKNKNRARLRFLVSEIGFDGLRTLYREELARLRSEAPVAPALRPMTVPVSTEPKAAQPRSEGFDAWYASNVSEQKQAGFFMVTLALRNGDLTSGLAEQLADVVGDFGEGVLRTTPSQNVMIRWVHEQELPGLHRALQALRLAPADSPVERELIACTGTATCRLGICRSPALAEQVHRALDKAGLDLADAKELTLNINGCPNACGRHPIGAIGLHGKARRIGGRLVPTYVMQLGGRVGEGKTRLAEGAENLPARNAPEVIVELLQSFRNSDQYPDFHAFLDDGGGRARAAEIVAGYSDVPGFEDDSSFYYDWGAQEEFSLAGRGAGECSAGVFDLIRVDLSSARDALAESKLLTATALGARAMLITQGEDVKDHVESLTLFATLFIDAGHVDASFRDLIEDARQRAAGGQAGEELSSGADRVAALIAEVETLYENMDQSLRFHRTNEAAAADEASATAAATTNSTKTGGVQEGGGSQQGGGTQRAGGTREASGTQKAGGARKASAATKASDAMKDRAATQSNDTMKDFPVDREADFRGITCPLNYVKTKMLLAQMQTGQTLSVLLDEAGGKSVPRSAEKDGHEVVLEQQRGDRWLVLVRKG